MEFWLTEMKPHLEKEIAKINKFRPVKNKNIKKVMMRNFRGLMSYEDKIK